jgi:hypothetical protein
MRLELRMTVYRKIAVTTVSLATAALGFTACSSDGGNSVANAVQSGVDRTQACTKVIAKIAKVHYGKNANVSDVKSQTNDLQSTADNLDDKTVKNAADSLIQATKEWVNALPDSDNRQQALDQVKSSAKKLSDACHVPVDQLVNANS